MQIDTFLARWRNAGGSERANYQLFIADLCALLEVEPPQPASENTRDNAYVFERRVIFHHGDGSTSNGFIDCYRRAALIGEVKKIRAGFETRVFDGAFTALLKSFLLPSPAGRGAGGEGDAASQFAPLVAELWQAMDEGKFSVAIRARLPHFNGKLFKNPEVLPVDRSQIELLLEAAKADWSEVEPAIFGTLLESALNPLERHDLGAH